MMVKIGGNEVEVQVFQDPYSEFRGHSDYDNELICLNYNDREKLMRRVFWHELVHFLLDDIAEHKLSQDEKFVELFSQRLLEMIDSNDLDQELEEAIEKFGEENGGRDREKRGFFRGNSSVRKRT
jgi:Zn-dependent peptidase ImmA (M78 family)